MDIEKVKKALEEQKSLREMLKSEMVEGIDYARLHIVSRSKCQSMAQGLECKNPDHYSKPILLKPGAELVAKAMEWQTPEFFGLEEIQRAYLSGQSLSVLVIRCRLKNREGVIVGEGMGARRVQEDDYGDVNKAIKMALKSAFVDAVIRSAGLSEFTQDLEAMNLEEKEETEEKKEEKKSEINLAQLRKIWAMARDKGVSEEHMRKYLRERLKVFSSKDLTKEQYEKVLEYLESFGTNEQKEDMEIASEAKKLANVGKFDLAKDIARNIKSDELRKSILDFISEAEIFGVERGG